MIRPLFRGRVLGGLLSVTVLTLVGLLTVSRMATHPGSDYALHAGFAQAWFEGRMEILPHFLFEALVVLVHLADPALSYLSAGLVVVVASFAFLGGAVFAFWGIRARSKETHDESPWVAVLAVIAISLQGVVFLPTMPARNLFFGYFPANVYFNPTIILLKPFAVLLFLCTTHLYTRGTDRTILVTAPVLAVLATLAKPSYTICILPAMALVAVARGIRGRVVNLRVVAAVAVPATLVLAIQLLLFGQTGYGGSISFHPLLVIQGQDFVYGKGGLSTPPWLVVKLVMSVALPLLVSTSYFRAAVRDGPLTLAWVAFILAAAYSYLLAEGPPHTGAGNLLWSAEVTAFILFAESLAFWWRQPRRSGGMGTAIATLAALQLATGLFWWWTELSPDPAGWW